MKKGYFVTGTDTGVGKTMVSCALIRSFSMMGKRTAGMKPVSSGGDDAYRLASAGGIALAMKFACPYDLSEPIAPHIAARHAGIGIEMEKIVQAYHAIEADVVVVEGIGGLLVPFGEKWDASDLIRMLGLSTILVVGMRLGAINHALLTFEALKSRGLLLSGWVANSVDPEMEAFDEVMGAIESRIDAPLIDVVPYGGKTLIDLSKLS